ncbi:PadR family transcriptional regulator [Thermoactinospora rubra]|uniref:PadR family transcriptional regulator n=1 Tax=Thermoactinospora rubra TaxID=1088767 RepID=UPI000A10B322|nr:PadR family transcriptional regulator [Thermoactinospora rubra]
MSLRHAVLGLLAESPSSGYDLLKMFDMSLANVWPATQSQVYGELAKLAADGLIQVTEEGPRGRKEYAITEEGRAELRRWIVEVEPNHVRRSDMLLRVFFLGQVDPGQARAYLRRQAELAAAEVARLEELARTLEGNEDDDLAVYGRLALEWGLRSSRMQREWAAWAEEQIR